MLEDKDLQAIAALIKAETEPLREEIKLIQNKVEPLQEEIKRTKSESIAMMEAYFDPKFNLLADGIADIQEKLVPRSRVDDLEEEVKFLKSVVRQINEDVQKLKKAN